MKSTNSGHPSVSGSTVLVTGGGSGLGLALVRRFVDQGANVTVLDRSHERLSALSTEFDPMRTCLVQGDVTRPADNQHAVDQTVNKFGRLDTFIANAAIWDFSLALLDTPIDALNEAFDELFAVNVKGYLLGARAAAPVLLACNGSIIFTLSNAALYPGGGGPLYTASKHAGVGLTRQLAYELAPKIRVNAVAPAGMPTDLAGPRALGQHGKQMRDDWNGEAFATRVPLGFLPEPNDYTGAYLYLANSSQSPTVTGAILACDMGLGVRGIRSVAGGGAL